MARQSGPFRLNGDMGDINYYFNRLAGRMVGRRKRENLSEEARTSPRYEVFRQHGAIHGASSKSCTLLKECIREAIKGAYDNKMNTRLVTLGKQIMRAAGEDNGHPFHTPKVTAFRDFRFNKKAGVANLVYSGMSTEICKRSYIMSFSAPDVVASRGCTHYQFACCVAGVDFTNRLYDGRYEKSELFTHGVTNGKFELNVEIPSGYPVYFGIVIFRQFKYLNGRYYMYTNYKGLAADITDVWIG